MTDKVWYIATIEGIGNATGQVGYCYPDVPTGASAAYVAGLAEPPTGTNATWDVESHSVSVGQFRLRMREGVGPISWYLTRPQPVADLREGAEWSDSDTTCKISRSNGNAGITTSTPVYVDRETVIPTVAGENDTQFTCTRGYAGSTASAHNDESDCFLVPPALTGREVKVYEWSANLVLPGTQILQGYIAGEVSSGLGAWPTLTCVDRFDLGYLNDRPEAHETGRQRRLSVRRKGGGPTISAPRTEGGYWYFPDQQVVLGATWDSSGLRWHFVEGDRNIEWFADWPRGGYVPSDDMPDMEDIETSPAYQILFSDLSASYPSFAYLPDGGSWTPSDNPIVIALNLLTSLDGTNKQASSTNYDLGATTSDGGLYPEFSLGVDADLIDLATWESVRDLELAAVKADRFWLGGTESETIREALHRLLAPWGYAAGCTRLGVWTLLRLQDIYPVDTTVTLNEQHISGDRILDVQFRTLGRSLDRVVLETDPGPDGESRTTFLVPEVTGRNYYPPHVGRDERFRKAPYSLAQFADGSPAGELVGTRMRRLADRVAFIKVPLTAKGFDLVDFGDSVELHDVSLRDPTTGSRLTSASSNLLGRVAHVEINWMRRTGSIEVILSDTPRVASMAPSAKVSSWSVLTATTYSRQVTGSGNDDAQRFNAADVVALVDSDFSLRSDDGSVQTLPVVQSTTATTIVVDTDFLATGGGTVTPADGDWIVPAVYDSAVAAQKTDHAFDASGGAAPSGDPALGAGDDAAYVIGD
jgi:hypothetical protein